MTEPMDDDAAARQIHDVLVQLTPTLGPSEMDEEGEALPGLAVDGPILGDWVLVMAWHTPDGRTRLTRATSERLAKYRENGLLHEALNDWE